MAIRVLLADDQSLVRAGIAMLLAAEPGIEVVGQASDGHQAIEQARRLHPDVVLMDVCMPGLDGVQATGMLSDDGFIDDPDNPIKVLVLTNDHVDETVYLALQAGASGFMLKGAAPDQLVAAIKAVAAGDAWLDPAVARNLLTEFRARPASQLPSPAEMDQLTAREREVLALVAHGMSNTEIACHLTVGEATVKTHFGRVLMKLGLRDRAQAVAASYQTGLVKPGSGVPSGSFRSLGAVRATAAGV